MVMFPFKVSAGNLFRPLPVAQRRTSYLRGPPRSGWQAREDIVWFGPNVLRSFDPHKKKDAAAGGGVEERGSRL
jgi:hypothetical protein